MRLAVITCWHNRLDMIADYEKVIDAGGVDELILVDNASDPTLLSAWGRVGMVLRNDVNVGFSRGNNQGLRVASADAVVFLNNDVRLTADTDWTQPLRDALRPGRLVGPEFRQDAHTVVDGRPLAYLDGWCLAGMRKDLLELGGFDESFAEPSYFGDNDLCLRARAAGMRLTHAAVPLDHLGNQTSQRDPEARALASAANHRVYVERARKYLWPAAA